MCQILSAIFVFLESVYFVFVFGRYFYLVRNLSGLISFCTLIWLYWYWLAWFLTRNVPGSFGVVVETVIWHNLLHSIPKQKLPANFCLKFMGLWTFTKGYRTQNWVAQSAVNHLCMSKQRTKANELWQELINVISENSIIAKNIEVIQRNHLVIWNYSMNKCRGLSF